MAKTLLWILKNWKVLKKKTKSKKRVSAERRAYLAHKEKTRLLVKERIEHFSQWKDFDYQSIRIKNSKRSWGSCSSKRNLNFNYKLIFLPPELADYIIVHELCHLEEMNHSPRFWKLVEEHVPTYKSLRKELRQWEKKGLYIA